MPREYQVKSEHMLPKNVFMQVIYIIRDYHRLLQEKNNIVFSSPFMDGQPRGSGCSDRTADKAVKLAAITDRLEAMDSARHEVNAKYSFKIKRDDVDYFDSFDAFEDYGNFCYILYDPEKCKQPAYITWKRFRQELAYSIAKNLNLI